MTNNAPTHRSRFSSWFAKKAKKLATSVAVAVVLAAFIRQGVAQTFVATNDAVAPEVPAGARVLVYKLDQSLEAGDIVVYRRADGTPLIGRVVSAEPTKVVVSRKGVEAVDVPAAAIVGRVVAGTR